MDGRIDNFTIGTTDYNKNFWNAMKGSDVFYDGLDKGRQVSTNSYVMPIDSNRKYMAQLEKENIFRQICTCIDAFRGSSQIWVSDNEDIAEWFEEFGTINVKESLYKFKHFRMGNHGLGIITRLEMDLASDIGFDIQKHLISDLAKRFAKAEEQVFISGNGSGTPTGILATTGGAEIGNTSSALTFDDVIKLYFSVDKEYRRKGVWLMNDETAQTLRTLKDDNGNHIWNHATGTILNKPVFISNYMPSVESGSKPIAFGDFSYYWVVNRFPITVRTLRERYIAQQQVGYLAHEFLDAKLIRTEAIKVLQIAAKE